LDEVFYATAATFAPELVEHDAFKTVLKGPWNVLSRLGEHLQCQPPGL
jgi:hypothetical protein